MKQLDYSKLLETEWANQFDQNQLRAIQYGLERGVNVGPYANPEFHWAQMVEIRRGLEYGLDVTQYAKPELKYGEMLSTLHRLMKEAGIE